MRKALWIILPILLLLSIQSTCLAQWSPPVGDPPSGDPLPSGPPATHSIAWAKSLPDDTVLAESVTNKLVTRTFPEFGYFYIQEPGAAFGMRIKSVACPNPGDEVTITAGTLKTVECQRYIDNASYTILSHNNVTKPVGMTNKAAGGGDFLYDAGPPIVGQQGLWDGNGLNNIGMLIRIWGRVTEIDTRPIPLYYYIDDGSGVDMGIDLEVAPGQAIPFTNQVGDYVYLTGISSCLPMDEWTVRVLRPCTPTVRLAKGTGQSDPATKSPIKYSVTFSEPVSGFTDSDVKFSGTARPTAAHVIDSGDHTTYSVELSGMSVTGTVAVRLDYGAAKSVYYEGDSLSVPNLSINYKAYVPFKVLNKRMGVGNGVYQRKPLK